MRSIPALVVVAFSAFASGSQDPASSRELGFETGSAGQAPADWYVPTAGWVAELVETGAPEGSVCAVLAKPGDSDAPFGNLMRSIDATEYRGRQVKLCAKIRVEGEGDGGRAQMWLRVDRPDQQMGAFDNMGDRPISGSDWTDATIEAEIDGDAEQIALGFMSIGGATLFVDAVKLVVVGKALIQEPSPPRAVTSRGLENLAAAARLLAYVRFFHPSDQVVAVEAWDHFAAHVLEAVEPATSAADLARLLQEALAPIAPSLAVWAGGAKDAPPLPTVPAGATGLVFFRSQGAGAVAMQGRPGAYSREVVREALAAAPDEESRRGLVRDKELGGGVSCRLPVKLYRDERGTLPHADAPAAWSSLDGKPKLTALNRSTRLVGVALCWGVMQHFYPYFDVVKTDWDAALTAALSKAAEDQDERAYLGTLSELIAKLHDGHGSVWNPSIQPKGMLPLLFAWAGDDLVVAGKQSEALADVRVGDVVLSIDGKTTSQCYEEVSRGISAATEGWRRYVAMRALTYQMPTSDPVSFRFRHPDGSELAASAARIRPAAIEDATEERPDDGAELVPGIVYFNLSGAEADALSKQMPALSAAKGIVFDLRGYPNSAAFELMSHLIDEEATSARWNVPIVTFPDHEGWTEWNQGGRWQLEPAEPRLKAAIAFLTDGRAISYAESIMGIVENYELGEIVGATTAGTNGNVNPFELPGGYTVSWTGMKVLKHDGSQHHGVGIEPTVPVVPTAQGIAEGRDEVLEKAVDVLQAKIATGEH